MEHTRACFCNVSYGQVQAQLERSRAKVLFLFTNTQFRASTPVRISPDTTTTTLPPNRWNSTQVFEFTMGGIEPVSHGKQCDVVYFHLVQ